MAKNRNEKKPKSKVSKTNKYSVEAGKTTDVPTLTNPQKLLKDKDSQL